MLVLAIGSGGMSCSSTLTSISRLLTTQIVEGVEYEVEGCEMPLYYGELKSGLCWMPDLAPPHTSNGRVNNATHSAFHLIAFGGGDDDELLRGLRSVSLAMSVGEAEPSVRVSNVVGLRGLIDRAMAIVGAAKVVSDTAPLLPLERSIVPGGGLPSRLLLRGQRERFKHSYNFCAVLIVCLAELRSFRAASCCSVLVVNGGFGFDVRGFSFISETT